MTFIQGVIVFTSMALCFLAGNLIGYTQGVKKAHDIIRGLK